MIQEKIHEPEYWACLWTETQRESILRQTQLEYPERWRRFYDEVADLWEPVAGGGVPGDAVATLLSDLSGGAGTSLKGSSVVDVGCGAGGLSLALAKRGARVTAVDDSPGMIGILNKKIGTAKFRDGGNVEARLSPWTEIEAGTFDLAVAAFFPPAWEPEGVSRFERLSRDDCALVLPFGADPFPIRAALWSALMKPGIPGRSMLLPYLFNYLYTLGRLPEIRHFSRVVKLDVDLETAVYFYARYFELFGHRGADPERTIRRVLNTFSRNGRIRATGESRAVLVSWKAPQD